MIAPVQTSGVVHAWPPEFATSLPNDHWLVLHSLPRQEKLLIADLRRRQIAGLIFYERRVRHYAKGNQVFEVPLLGGYVFAHLPRERRDEAYATGRVCRVIDVNNPAVLTEDLHALCGLLEAAGDAPLTVKPELIPGVKVMITAGTFSGCFGVVSRRKGTTELVVNLPILGQSVATVVPLSTANLAD